MAIPEHKFVSAHFTDNARTTVEVEWEAPDGKTRVEYIMAEEDNVNWKNLLEHISIDELHEATYKYIKNSQRNFYFQSAVSTKNSNFIYGVHGDWETRRYFIGFDYKEIKNIIDYTDKHIQLGFAPYLGAYGDLHTWLMLKTKKNSLSKKQITYPVVKFFKGNVLLELGYDKKTDWDIHLMYRF